MKSIINIVSNYIGWDEQYLVTVSSHAPTSYRRYEIPKNNGGTRSVFQPSAKTKALQYAIIETILKQPKLFPHQIAVAYIEGRKSPLVYNAMLHRSYKYSIKVDLKNFFPSIRPDDIISIIQSLFSPSAPLCNEDIVFLTNSLFLNHPKYGVSLAIGAPSSPIISNIVMKGIDELIYAFAKERNAVVSRYADDFVFSSNAKGACDEFFLKLHDILISTASPSLKINHDKTAFMSKGTRRVITGLVITPDGGISIGRRQKRYIKKLIFDSSKRTLTIDEIKYLIGYLAFVKDVEPAYIDRLIIKYGFKDVMKFINPKSYPILPPVPISSI